MLVVTCATALNATLTPTCSVGTTGRPGLNTPTNVTLVGAPWNGPVWMVAPDGAASAVAWIVGKFFGSLMDVPTEDTPFPWTPGRRTSAGLTVGLNVRGWLRAPTQRRRPQATEKAAHALLGDARKVAGDEHVNVELRAGDLVQRAAHRPGRPGPAARRGSGRDPQASPRR